MAPHAEEGPTSAPVPVIADTTAYGGHVKKQNNTTGNGTDIANHIQTSKPLQLSGSLEEFDYFDVTPVIGREYKDVDLATWLQSSNSEELLRDLAITSNPLPTLFPEDFRLSIPLTNLPTSLPTRRRLLPLPNHPHRPSPKTTDPAPRCPSRQTRDLHPPYPPRIQLQPLRRHNRRRD